MSTFYTSDLHLNHENILKFSQRPFENVDDMFLQFVNNFNEVVSVDDELWILGDMAMGRDKVQIAQKFLDRLVCKNVHVIKGNHDPSIELIENMRGIIDVKEYDEQNVSKRQSVVLSHYPFASWNGSCRGSYMLHGHIHSIGTRYNNSNRDHGIRRYDVGVDANAFYPVSYEQLASFFSHGKTNNARDCHGELDFIK